MDPLEAVLSLEEAGELYGRTANSLRTAAKRGRLRAKRIRSGGANGSGMWLTTREAVEAYIIEADRWHARRARMGGRKLP